jgi:hypothetical protein
VFLQIIYKAVHVVFKAVYVEIYQLPQLQAGKLEVGKQLLVMHRQNDIHRFQFHDDFTLRE